MNDVKSVARKTLAKCRPFADLPTEVMGKLASSARMTGYSQGDLLIRQGDPGDSLLVLVSGTASIRVAAEGGAVHELGTVGPGDVVGEMALVTREDRNANVVAESAVQALELPSRDFDTLAALHPQLGVVLTTLVADRLGQGSRDGLHGKVLSGYRIRRCVGRGGMAVVYKAEQIATGATVALKMMSHRLRYEQGALSRFRREAEAIQSLEHENIARLHETFAEYGTHFLVMEFCEGPDLYASVSEPGLPESTVRKLVGQIASALNYVHGAGLVHRDLKPSNVMLSTGGLVKLVDFGLARPGPDLDDTTQTMPGRLSGTPAYMSPEQLSGHKLDGRNDIYALACMSHELLTGKKLFRASSLFELVQAKLAFELAPAEEIGGGISREMHDFLDQGLRRSVDERLSSLESVLDWRGPVDASELK